MCSSDLADEVLEKEVILCPEHRALAREAARKSFVLLKNEEVLPLKKEQKVAYIGPYVANKRMMGAWSFIGEGADVVTLKEAAVEWYQGDQAIFLEGCPVLGNDVVLEGFREGQEEGVAEDVQEKMLEDALQAAKEAEVVVMALGEHFLESGEATSKTTIELPEVQMALFRKIREVNDKIIVVVCSGRPLDLRELARDAKGILQVWMPGTEAGHAIMDVLAGDYNPSGKLPMSFPYSVGQVPIHYNEYATGRPHQVGKDKDRFRSKYINSPNAPLYPFGYGLSYTSFEVSSVVLDKGDMKRDETISASVVLKNTGKVAGTETLQLYIRDLTASVVRPVKELKGFEKVTLQPGEAKEVCFTITDEQLKYYMADGVWGSEVGAFEIFIGSDSTTTNGERFNLID